MNPLPFILLAISLPLLLGSVCNAELRTWNAVNGKEVEAEFVSNEKGIVKLKLKSGKIFEVPADKLSKEDNEFIGSLAKPEGVFLKETERRDDGFTYLKGSDTPYTGKIFINYENGQKRAEANYKDGKGDGLAVSWHQNGTKAAEVNHKDGKQEGLSVRWHQNGTKAAEGNYKDGKADGLSVKWYENGQKKAEVNHKDGKKDGLSVKWHQNGTKAAEGNYKDGEVDGLWLIWHENGQKMAEANWKGRKIEGSAKYWNSKGEPVDSLKEANIKPEESVAETKPKTEGVNYDDIEYREDIYYVKGSDTPYTGKSYRLHPNGQKELEENFKDGKRDGLFVGWYENGQKRSEGNYKDGEQYGLYPTWHENGEKRSEVNIKDGLYDGLLTGWHDNGQKAHESNWKDGKIVSQKDWDEEGELIE
jgi:antitoxin component YwqK of YwqJK toxin-antitoxin module